MNSAMNTADSVNFRVVFGLKARFHLDSTYKTTLGDLTKAVKKQMNCIFNAELAGLLEYQVYAHRAIAEMQVELCNDFSLLIVDRERELSHE